MHLTRRSRHCGVLTRGSSGNIGIRQSEDAVIEGIVRLQPGWIRSHFSAPWTLIKTRESSERKPGSRGTLRLPISRHGKRIDTSAVGSMKNWTLRLNGINTMLQRTHITHVMTSEASELEAHGCAYRGPE